MTGFPAARRWTGRRTWEREEEEITTRHDKQKRLFIQALTVSFCNVNVLLGLVLWKPGEIEPLLLQVSIEAFLDVI